MAAGDDDDVFGDPLGDEAAVFEWDVDAEFANLERGGTIAGPPRPEWRVPPELDAAVRRLVTTLAGYRRDMKARGRCCVLQ